MWTLPHSTLGHSGVEGVGRYEGGGCLAEGGGCARVQHGRGEICLLEEGYGIRPAQQVTRYQVCYSTPKRKSNITAVYIPGMLFWLGQGAS